jgi:DUF4097 and DUF4098 domain-containing protein YvlB
MMTKRALLCVLLMMSFAVASVAAKGKGEAVLQDSFEYSQIRKITISDGAIFDFEIKGYSGAAVRVEVFAANEKDKLEHRQSGSELILSYARDVEMRSIGASAPRAVIRAPSAMELDIRTTTGNVSVETVNGPKRLVATTGTITVRSSRGRVSSKSTTGDQRFDYVQGDIEAESTTGSIELTNTEGTLDIESTTGGQNGRELKVTGDSRFQTSTGRIELDFANPTEDFTFDLSSTTGRMDVGDTEVRGTLVQGSGPIRIVGRTTTGRQVYR